MLELPMEVWICKQYIPDNDFCVLKLPPEECGWGKDGMCWQSRIPTTCDARKAILNWKEGE